MDVPPHPHTGLQTVSWLFSGEVEHRDSAGVHAMVRPGELNLMTAGAGICHSEVSTAATTVLHGVQLWVALPDVRPRHRIATSPISCRRRDRSAAPRCGSSSASSSAIAPPCTPSRRCSVRSSISIPGAEVTLDVDPAFEHGVLLDQGSVEVAGTDACRGRPGIPGRRARPSRGGQPRPRPRASRAPRRSAVSRAAGDVVELRRAQPRRHRAVPADVAGPRRPLRCGAGISRIGVTPARAAAAKCDVASTAQSRGIEDYDHR